jgi:hypothetical protein
MSSLESTLSALIQDFVERVGRALREDAASMAPRGASARAVVQPTRAAKATATIPALPPALPPAAPSAKPTGGRPGKRAAPPVAARPAPKPPLANDIVDIVERIVAALANGPLLSEDLRDAVGVSRERLSRPLREALRRRRVVRRGERRLTTYALP